MFLFWISSIGKEEKKKRREKQKIFPCRTFFLLNGEKSVVEKFLKFTHKKNKLNQNGGNAKSTFEGETQKLI